MKKLLTLFLALCLATACSDESTPMFSQRAPVFCYFNVTQYAELFTVMGNPGQYATIRNRVVDGVTKIVVRSIASSQDYNIDALSKNFQFGLGGLIVGTNHYGETMCYDLACPICDRANRRLTTDGTGTATCEKCGVSFDMNNYGAIRHVPEGAAPANPRGLYRYRIRFDGQTINAYN